jgi:hypothetical protein
MAPLLEPDELPPLPELIDASPDDEPPSCGANPPFWLLPQAATTTHPVATAKPSEERNCIAKLSHLYPGQARRAALRVIQVNRFLPSLRGERAARAAPTAHADCTALA